MGNCCRKTKKSKRKIVLLLVGLDNAGKTVAVKGLAGEDMDTSVPTVGFSLMTLKYLGFNVQIYDLGGGLDIRGIWHRYFVDAHGIIFVVDSSDYQRLNEVKIVLRDLLSHEKIAGKPVLLLANKQDFQEALDEIDLVEKLDLEHLVNEQKCPTLVESCTAIMLSKKNKRIDSGIKNGYQWLLNFILRDYENLNTRVARDVEEQKVIESQAMFEKIKRLKQRKENECKVKMRAVDDQNKIMENFKAKKHVKINNKSPCLSVRQQRTPRNLAKEVEKQRPKSAVEGVRKQLETIRRNSFFTITSNKTSPVTLLVPKKANASVSISNTNSVQSEAKHELETRLDSQVKRDSATNRDSITNNDSPFKSDRILTVTQLPNAIIDRANGDHIGDLFQLNECGTHKSASSLPPIKNKMNGNGDVFWIQKSINTNVNNIQTDIDGIFKDI